jgi:hypothetical protein
MGWMVNATPPPLYPQVRPGTHCVGGCVGPRAGLDWCGKICSPPIPPGVDPPTVQPVASRYTDSQFKCKEWVEGNVVSVKPMDAYRGVEV